MNFAGNLNCTKTALDLMIPKKSGGDRFHQLRCEPREAVYGGMKAAVNSFMKPIARREWTLRHPLQCRLPGRDHSAQPVGCGIDQHVKPTPGEMFAEDQLEQVLSVSGGYSMIG